MEREKNEIKVVENVFFIKQFKYDLHDLHVIDPYISFLNEMYY